MGIMGKKIKNTVAYWRYMGIMEKTLETTIVYWRYMGIISATDPNSDGRALRYFFPSLATPYEPFVRGFLFRLLERCLE